MKKLLAAIIILFALCSGALAVETGHICTQFTGTLPYVACDGEWWTGIAVCNKRPVDGCLYVRFAGGAWECHKIEAEGVTTFMLECGGQTYAEFKSSMPFVIFEALSNGTIAFDYVMELEPCGRLALALLGLMLLPAMAMASDQLIKFAWDRSPEKEVVGYQLYRKSVETDEYKKIGAVIPQVADGIEPTTSDTVPYEEGKTYWYVITAKSDILESGKIKRSFGQRIAYSSAADRGDCRG